MRYFEMRVKTACSNTSLKNTTVCGRSSRKLFALNEFAQSQIAQEFLKEGNA
jgi:hypothetical protein